MKPLKIAGDLVLYNLRLLPRNLWVLLILLSLFEVVLVRATNEWAIGGASMTNLQGFPILYCAVFASVFFKPRTSYAGGQILDGEFLLSRPIIRRTAYLSRVVLYFIIMLVVPLVEVHTATAKPDVRVDFYSWVNPGATAGQIKFYKDQFPESSMIHQPYAAFQKKLYEATLIIPFGAVKVALWDLLVTMALALILQLAMLFTAPSKVKGMSFFVLLLLAYFLGSVFIVVMFPQFRGHLTMYEHAFFYFMHHVFQVALWTAAAFLLVQEIALRRIRKFEVI